jgi:hypothetical protein
MALIIIFITFIRPVPEAPSSWKGVLNNGKTGLFNPAHSVAYLGNILPSVKPQFSRGGTFTNFPM